MYSLLIVEDCPDAFALIRKAVLDLAYISWAKTIAEARILINSITFDVILMDGILPDGCGFELAQEIKQSDYFKTTSVAMLTAKNSTDDRVRAFDFGIDLYIAKPFHMRELRAQVGCLLKRTGKIKNTSHIDICGLMINKDTQKVHTVQGAVELTSTEFKVLMVLVNNLHRVNTREEISATIWDEDANLRQVDTHISKLRKKIGQDKIISVHGLGYKLAS